MLTDDEKRRADFDYLFKSHSLKLLESDWLTPNTFNRNFKSVPTTSGVYLLIYFNTFTYTKTILYIGSAKNLKQRYERHEVRRILSLIFNCVMFYFKETPNYKEMERKLIETIQPKFNRQYNQYEGK